MFFILDSEDRRCELHHEDELQKIFSKNTDVTLRFENEAKSDCQAGELMEFTAQITAKWSADEKRLPVSKVPFTFSIFVGVYMIFIRVFNCFL